MRIKRMKIHSIVIIMFSMATFVNSYLCLTWETYPNRIISLITKLIPYATLGILFLCLLNKSILHKTSKKVLISCILYVLFVFHISFMGSTYNNEFIYTDILYFLLFFMYMLFSRETKASIFILTLKIFSIIVLPSIIYFYLLNFGLDLPFEVLESTHVAKVEFGFFYKHLPFGLVINTVRLGRPTGLFDEPGFIGTLAALFIAGAYGKVDKKWIYLLLFEGLSSFSMAFYLITILYFSTKMFEKGYRKLCFLLAGCVIIMIIFNTFTFTNPFLLSIQDRLAISVNIIFDNNRTLGSYDIVFKDFLDSGGYAILFGNGRHAVFNNALLSNSSTYKNLIYDYGVIGCMILVSFFVSLINYIRMDKRMLPFLLVFSISVYQRPNIFNLQMIALFTGALCLIVEDSKKNFFLTKQT